MKKVLKLAIALALVVAMLLLGACSANNAVATVGGQEIPFSSFQNAFRNYQSYNGQLFSYDLSTEEGLADYRSFVINALIEQEMFVYQAGQLGFTLSDEEKAAAKEQGIKDFEDIYQQYLSYAKQAGAQDATVYANNQLTNVLSSNGLTLEGFKKQLIESAERSALTEKVTAYLRQQGEPDAAKLEDLFLAEQATQKAAMDENPAEYFMQETLWSYYVQYGYDLGAVMPLYVPAGMIRVRNILVEDEETAKQLYTDIVSGARDFEEVLAEYNTDPGMDSNPEGYLVAEGANYVPEFLEAALALENDGDVSTPVETEYGWHIIKRVKTEEAHNIPYEGDVKTIMDAYFKDKQINAYVTETMSDWIAQEGLVTRNESLINSVK